MLNLMDAENAIMTGNARYEKWLREFELNWNKPMMETMLLVMWRQLPDEVKTVLAERKPEQMKVVSDWIESIGNGGG